MGALKPVFALFWGCLIFEPYAQFTFPGCKDLVRGDFKLVEVTKSPAYHLQHLPDGRIFYTSGRGGEGTIHVYDAAKRTSIALKNSGGGRNFGIALAPDFDQSKWIYTYDSKVFGKGYLYRQTYDESDHSLNSKKLILEYVDGLSGTDHAGGGFAFDRDGNLLLAIGDNANPGDGFGSINESKNNFSSLRTAANTNSLMGKLLRIKPIPFPDNQNPKAGLGQTYAVPPGNLGETFRQSMNWTPQDMEKIRPEVYTMGHRNPWNLGYDPAHNWILLPEPGPRAEANDPARGPMGGDEFNLVKSPGNYGWPMFIGPNLPFNFFDYQNNKMGPWFDPAQPTNTSRFNTGVEKLPPPRPALFFHLKNQTLMLWQKGAPVVYDTDKLWNGTGKKNQATVAGPMVNYSVNSTDAARLPPQLHRSWLISDYYLKTVKALALDETGENVLGIHDVVDAPASVTNLSINHQGVAYMTAQTHGMYRIEYTGTCQTKQLPAVSVHAALHRSSLKNSTRMLITQESLKSWPPPPSAKSVSLFDLQGKLLFEKQLSDGNSILPEYPKGKNRLVMLVIQYPGD